MAKFSKSINAPKKRLFRVIGLMSGTSMDGIDVAVIETNGRNIVKTKGFASYPYKAGTRKKIHTALGKLKAPALEKELTRLHAQAVKDFLKKHKLRASDFDCIGFHGHTLHHDPSKKITVQIGDGKLLHKLTGIPVVYDFRSEDMKAGGQGAPLVPAYHQAIAPRMKQPVVFLNIGGVANITYVGKQLLACDTGPGNAMIDDWMRRHKKGAYDKNGKLASKGKVDAAWVKRFLKHAYFKKKAPKSLDRNAFAAYMPKHLNLEDGASTLTQMTVAAIAHTLKQFTKKPAMIVVCGGGRKNIEMLHRIQKTTNIRTLPIEWLKFNGDAIEAQAFAYLAVREILGLPISFKTTTGRK
jgi:anhydro-N-acetylmuramic acid kinase